MKASDITLDRNLSFLLKGPPGHSKTLSAASFALDGPVYFFYFDKKKPIELVSYFSKMGSIGKRILDNIEYDVYGAHNANEYLNKVIKMGSDCRWFAVVTDSLTNLTSAAVNWSLSFRDDRKGKEKLKIIPDFDEYKVETSLVTQALDIFRTLPCHIIWTAHPVPSIKIEGSGASIRVTKVNPIVTYGSKVAGIVPGNFSEIYHFNKEAKWDAQLGKNLTRYIVSFDAIGDEYAKSNLGLTGELDITNGLFYEIWKAKVKQHTKELEDAINEQKSKPINPFATNPTVTETIMDSNTGKVWNPSRGVYE